MPNRAIRYYLSRCLSKKFLTTKQLRNASLNGLGSGKSQLTLESEVDLILHPGPRKVAGSELGSAVDRRFISGRYNESVS